MGQFENRTLKSAIFFLWQKEKKNFALASKSSCVSIFFLRRLRNDAKQTLHNTFIKSFIIAKKIVGNLHQEGVGSVSVIVFYEHLDILRESKFMVVIIKY